MLTRSDCLLFNTDTCYVLGVAKANLFNIRQTSLLLECGETLYPGDGVKEIGTKGYAANPNIHMADGWTQYFVGTALHEHSSGPTTLALFKSWNDDGESAFKSRETSDKYKGYEWFIAYAWCEANKSFGYWTPAISLRWINTDRIVRKART